ncbi:helicase-related protein [Paenibacillus herberti]|uniref:helicase-related protein n=1 Tax=Paenibacillus herberti TaxID=1619309 RepID=UPI0015960616|nr:helicase-related protein [Paenibacillus herberti]
MRVTLYVYLQSDTGWKAGVSIAPEIDCLWRLDAGWAEEAGHEAGQRADGAADSMLICETLLPLGKAYAAMLSWNYAQAGVAAAKIGARPWYRARVSAQKAAAPAGAALSRPQAAEALRRLARTALSPDGHAGPSGGLIVTEAMPRHGSRFAAAALPPAAALAREACFAAASLQGRALLRSEAQALLGAAGAAVGRCDAALQLAALLGRLRLGSAVAAGRARRRKGGFAALRCQRCGSGEAQLLRTACATCGSSSCACCQACLTMGRSRECGLLVFGMPAQSWQGASLAPPQVLPPAADRLRRWGLSPAQAAATTAALAFLEQPASSLHAAPPVNSAPSSMVGSHILTNRSSGLSCHQAAPPVNSASPPGRFASSLGVTARARLRALLSCIPKLPGLHAAAESHTRSVIQPSPRPAFLLWAVTGAGKTEMVFPLLESVLLRGGKALLATPRKDVVLELEPRLRRAFPNIPIVTLYGGSPQRWESGSLFLATTHQLMRFREAFNLIILDELDAFPFANNELLHTAAARSCRPDAKVLLLTATPSVQLQRLARTGFLPHAKVPVRYHRQPLPVPRMLSVPTVSRILAIGRLPRKLLQAMRQSLERGAQVFVFIPAIRDVHSMVMLLRKNFPDPIEIEGTHSQDPARGEKVQQFRDRTLRVLVTTTILERGVTIPRSDVFILDANSGVFNEASLVQSAGRAGRSVEDPHGRVWFAAAERSASQKRAIRQIKLMNRAARQGGYLNS